MFEIPVVRHDERTFPLPCGGRHPGIRRCHRTTKLFGLSAMMSAHNPHVSSSANSVVQRSIWPSSFSRRRDPHWLTRGHKRSSARVIKEMNHWLPPTISKHFSEEDDPARTGLTLHACQAGGPSSNEVTSTALNLDAGSSEASCETPLLLRDDPGLGMEASTREAWRLESAWHVPAGFSGWQQALPCPLV